jgi:hypothetical protein
VVPATPETATSVLPAAPASGVDRDGTNATTKAKINKLPSFLCFMTANLLIRDIEMIPRIAPPFRITNPSIPPYGI